MKNRKGGLLYNICFWTVLLAFSVYALLDTFIIPHEISAVDTTQTGSQTTNQARGETADQTTDGTTSQTRGEAANQTTGKTTDETTNQTTGETTSRATDQTTDQATGKTTDGATDQATNQATNQKTAQSAGQTSSTDTVTEGTYTDNSYSDDNISITIETKTIDDTVVYIADVTLSDASYLQTALAKDTFGTNVTETTSSQAEAKNAIFAVNGDYYGANKSGYVIKNGTIYRDSVRSDSENDDLVIYEDGSFGIINETEISAEDLLKDGVTQLFAFGPTLVENGELAVDENTEVGKAMSSNPRTAIGIIDDLHYIIVVADGRSSESQGLSLYQLAEVMQDYGCTTAYNLDGGGSSTMYFNGQVINKPTTNGKTFKEREVSDIVYIGY